MEKIFILISFTYAAYRTILAVEKNECGTLAHSMHAGRLLSPQQGSLLPLDPTSHSAPSSTIEDWECPAVLWLRPEL